MQVRELQGGSRFSWPENGINGFDCRDEFTINDLWGVVSWIWTWPGDWLLSQEGVQTFLDMDPGTVIGSWWSSAIGWFILMVFSSVFSSTRP
jgi:hypothetical protein